jgi:hypothetical protein
MRPIRALLAPWLLAGAALATLSADGVSAQEVVLRGAADVAVDRRLTRLIAMNPTLVLHNTEIAEGDTVRGSVLVLDASLVHEGVILGDLVLVDAGAFVRPGAVVTGDLVNIAGGLYRSELSVVGGSIVDLPVAPYRVIREPGLIIIQASAAPSPLILDGLMGFHVPTYDRVNGVSLVWGATYQFPTVERVVPRAHAQVGWHTERGDPGYRLDVAVQRAATTAEAGHERSWDTNERWIRGDLINSVHYLWNGRDYRDYHEVERSWVGVSRALADRARRLTASAYLRGQVEDAGSLRAGEPWFLLGSATRPNPPVDDGRTTSLVAGLTGSWNGPTVRFTGQADYEAARDWRGGEFRFDRVSAQGDFAMAALWNHTLAIEFFLQTPLGRDPLPAQRWSFVGGPGTLHTLPLAAYYGDHVVFVESRYIIPLPDRLALPFLGAPRLHLLHSVGMAWLEHEDRGFHQEIGALADLGVLHVRFTLVPEDPGTNDLSVSLAWPLGRRYPWERPQERGR